MKKLFVLGSTGSIGVNTLNVVRKFDTLFSVEAITTNCNIDLLAKQIDEFKPKFAVITNFDAAKKFNEKYFGKTKILVGKESLVELAKNADYDILVSALVGFAGLAPTIESIKRSKRIALANKETLVSAGKLIIELSEKFNAEIIPVDSEHSAIFQCLVGEKTESIKKRTLEPNFNLDDKFR